MLSAFISYINDNFGSKRGLLRSAKFKILLWLGVYKKYQNINFAKVDRLVFICSGNICRSPFGEYVAKAKNIASVSYGLHCRGGDAADERAIEFAKEECSLDMSGHITTNISDYQEREGDLLVVMEPKHLEELLPLLKKDIVQTTIVTLWCRSVSAYLHDPFSASRHFFWKCEYRIVEAVANLSKKLG